MLGPVFRLELLLGGRRGRQYVFRWLYAGLLTFELLVAFCIYQINYNWPITTGTGSMPDTKALSDTAESFVQFFLTQQYVLILLATPAFAAGAVTDEKTRGTLIYLLTADLTPGQIVLGKLLGRVFQVLLLMLAGLPVLCVVGVWGGMTPTLLGAVVLGALGPLVALGAASVLASVWARQTRDAVLSLYAVGGLGYLAYQLLSYALPGGLTGGLAATAAGVLHCFNPLYVLEPARGVPDFREALTRLAVSWAAWGAVAGVCTGLAIARLRGAYVKQLENTGALRLLARILPARKPVGGDPVRWLVRHVEGIAPFAVLRLVPRWLGMLAVFALTVAVSLGILWESLPTNLPPRAAVALLLNDGLPTLQTKLDADVLYAGFRLMVVAALLLSSLVVGIRCSGAVTGERERSSWEALLLTPLETRQLIRGKLYGVIGSAQAYVLAYAVPALLFAAVSGPVALVVSSIGLGVIELGMFFIGSAGIWCSVRSRGSWRALLGTLGWGYLGGMLLYFFSVPVILLLAFIVYVFLNILAEKIAPGRKNAFGTFGEFGLYFFLLSCFVMVAVFFGTAWFFIKSGEKRVSQMERTRIWRSSTLHRRRRRIADPRRLPSTSARGPHRDDPDWD
jgi:ABC-type transport system involved in multi-copper enzyme maturation permease subunit